MKSVFSTNVGQVLKGSGFVKKGSLFLYKGAIALVMINLQRSSHSPAVYINVGILIRDISSVMPSRSELSHCHFRLERLFPHHRELILEAGCPDSCSEAVFEQFSSLFTFNMLPLLINISEKSEALIEAYKAGQLTCGLVRPEARRYFDSITKLNNSV